MNLRTVFCAVTLAILLANVSQGTPIQWSGNGHYYELVSPALKWTDACADAATLTHLGMIGHLATITSAGEAAFIQSNFLPGPDAQGYWLGGYQAPGSGEPNSGWQWITGEAFTYTQWAATEPNNFGCSGSVEEDNLQLSIGNIWNDAGWCACYPYIVEYESGSFGCATVEDGNCPGSCVPACDGDSTGSSTCGCKSVPSLNELGIAFLLLALLVFGGRFLLARPARLRP